jgi:hypothetical protein
MRNGCRVIANECWKMTKERKRMNKELRTLASLDEEFAGASDKANSTEPERALAAGVLRQAASDLRRFRQSEDAVGREMYWDARSWFNSNDTEWPYSFLNVCKSLSISAENIRDEVFADAQSGWLSHSRRVALATATEFVRSLSTFFLSRRSSALPVRHS